MEKNTNNLEVKLSLKEEKDFMDEFSKKNYQKGTVAFLFSLFATIVTFTLLVFQMITNGQ